MEAVSDDPKQLVISLGQQGKHWREIALEAGTNPNTVKTWLRRAGIRIGAADSITKAVVREERNKDAPNIDSSAIVRNRLGNALIKVTEALERLPLPRTITAMRNHAELIKDISDPAKSVFGWSDQSTTTVVSLTHLAAMKPANVIDVGTVQPTVEQSTPCTAPDGTVQDVPVQSRE